VTRRPRPEVPNKNLVPTVNSAGVGTPRYTLRGIIDDEPFVGRAAALVRPNRPGRGFSTRITGTGRCSSDTDGYEFVASTLLITEVAGSCADFEARQFPETRPGRSIELELRAAWPVPAGTSLRTDIEDPRQDHLEAGLIRPGNSPESRTRGDGLIAEGTLTIVSVTANAGVVAVDLRTTASDHARGQIPFVVCP
jgi:hypothetical protein